MKVLLSWKLHSINYTGWHKKNSFPVKIQVDYYSFDIAESDYDKQSTPSPTNVKGEGINLLKPIVYVMHQQV
jgi:hypothetical protein